MKLNALISIIVLLYLQQLQAIVGESLNSQPINPLKKLLQSLHNEPNNGRNHNEEPTTKHGKNPAVQEKWLQQPVDHYASDGSNHTWMMRYFENFEFYQTGAPIFIYVGGEWDITPSFLESSHFRDIAKQHKGIMFYTEHRYYGKSWPTRDASTKNLQYLNVLQSLEDLNYFIEYQKFHDTNLQNSKVVLVGGSYSGSMVSWFMKLYPHMADVAWASSAPLIAKMDFHEYMTLAWQSIKEKGGAKCARNLLQAFRGLQITLSSGKANKLMERLGSCTYFDVNNKMDIAALFNVLGNYFAQVVQGQSYQITQFCTKFLAIDNNPMEALIKYFREFYLPAVVENEQIDDQYCLDVTYGGMKSIFSLNGDVATRCWFYQTCHEFGWFTTTTTHNTSSFSSFATTNSPFAGQISLDFFHRLCQDVFGQEDSVGGFDSLPQLLARADGINHIFGGLNNISQRVIFTHGLLDPWRAVGQQQGNNVLLLRDYSHVEDMGPIDLSDTVEMNVAKLKVAEFINKALRN